MDEVEHSEVLILNAFRHCSILDSRRGLLRYALVDTSSAEPLDLYRAH